MKIRHIWRPSLRSLKLLDLVIFNSLSRRKEAFVPLVPGQIKMYCCGPTVYDFLHVGNFRGPVFFNFVRNFLEQLGFKVTFALNFTDIDDKILTRAQADGVDPRALASRYIKEYRQDYEALGLRPHDLNPTVTESMADIIAFIEQLIAKGSAYETSGNVYYAVRSFGSYGKLSGRNLDDQLSGVRIDLEADKRDPQDFALWKMAKPNEESWPSPWGAGRPGWHIECSAMVHRHLGEQIDIHGGGTDLKFPHHENEIAQSEAHSGCTFVRYWMHHHLFTFGGQKMSKSLGNLITMRDFLATWHPEIYKQLVLSHHYRSDAEFSERSILDAIAQLNKVYSALATAEFFLERGNQAQGIDNSKSTPEMAKAVETFRHKAMGALQDDFNTPLFYAAFHELLHEFNKRVNRGMPVNEKVMGNCLAFREEVRNFAGMMALYQEQPGQFLTHLTDLLLREKQLSRPQVQDLVDARAQARLQKDFAKSDVLRDQLLALGIAIQDSPSGTHWEVRASSAGEAAT